MYEDAYEGWDFNEAWYEAHEAAMEALEPALIPWWVNASASSGVSGPERTPRDGEAVPGNTAIHTSQIQQWQVSGGLDMLEVTCYGAFSWRYSETEQKLEAGRQARIDGRRCLVDVLGASLYVRERGHRWGAAFFPWVADYDGITVSLNRQHNKSNVPVAKVQIGSLKLTKDGHRAAWKHALRILEELGIEVTDTSVARLDICIDQAGVKVDPYCEAIFNRQVITRIKSQATFYRSAVDGVWAGVSVGARSDVHLRIYDKLAELARGGPEAAAKLAALIERRWGCVPECATRVEFQVKGQWLRDKWSNCRTVEQVFDRLDSIVAYLCEQYFRLVDGDVDRANNNQDRAEVSPLWGQVTESFLDWVDKASIELVKLEKKPVDRSKAGRRLFSAALGVAALAPGRVVDRVSFLQEVCDVLIKNMPPEWEWQNKLRERWDKMQASGAASVFTFEEMVPRFSCGYEISLTDVSGFEDWDETPDASPVSPVPF